LVIDEGQPPSWIDGVLLENVSSRDKVRLYLQWKAPGDYWWTNVGYAQVYMNTFVKEEEKRRKFDDVEEDIGYTAEKLLPLRTKKRMTYKKDMDQTELSTPTDEELVMRLPLHNC